MKTRNNKLMMLLSATIFLCLGCMPCRAETKKLGFTEAVISSLKSIHRVQWDNDNGEEVCAYIRLLFSNQFNVMQEAGRVDPDIRKKFTNSVVPEGFLFSYKADDVSLQEVISNLIKREKLVAVIVPEGLFFLPRSIGLDDEKFVVVAPNIMVLNIR